MCSKNFVTNSFWSLLFIFLFLGVTNSVQAQDLFVFDEDTLRMETDCPDLRDDEAEYVFIMGQADLKISGVYSCDSIAPSFQFIDNQYQYLVRLKQLKKEKKRNFKFGLKGYSYTGEYKVSAKRKSRHYIHVTPSPNYIVLTEVQDGGSSIVPGCKYCVQMVFRSALNLNIETLVRKARIDSVRTESGLIEYSVMVDKNDIDPDSADVYIATADGTSNILRKSLIEVAKIKARNVYQVSLVNIKESGKPKERTFRFQVEPAEAQYIMHIDGTQMDVGVNDKYMYMGRHDILIESAYYHTLDTFVIIDNPSEDKSETFTLRPKFGAITINNSESRGATILLDGEDVGTAPTTIQNVMSGRHHIEVRKRGCVAYQTIITVEDSKNTDIIPRFTKKTKLSPQESKTMLNVEVKPAKIHPYCIITDNRNDSSWLVEIEKSGIGQLQLTPGDYKYFVSAPKYHPTQGSFTVNNASPQYLEVSLTPDFGTLVVKDNTMKDAIVSIDGDQKGRVPCTINQIPSGVHFVQIAYKEINVMPIRKKIEVNAGEVTTLSDFQRKKNFVNLIFEANDSVCLTINGRYMGFGSTEPEPFKHSPVTIFCQQEGYHDSTILFTFQLGDPDSTIVIPKLRRKMAFLVANTVPSVATVYVDSHPVGTTPATKLEIPTGQHTITINKKGYTAFDTLVNLSLGQTFYLQDVRLHKEKKKIKGKTLLLASYVPFAGKGYTHVGFGGEHPAIGVTIGYVKRLGWYINATTNFQFDNPTRSVNKNGYTNNGNLVLFNENSTSNLTYFTGTVGLNFRILRPLWVYAGGGYGIQKVTIKDAQNSLFYIAPYSTVGYCAEVGAGLALGSLAITGGINVIDCQKYFQGKPEQSCITYRLGVGFAF